MISDDKLRRILDDEIENAIGYIGGELQSERDDALDAYLGEATGDLAPSDIPGRSRVVSTDTADVIEWILPQVLKPFVQSDDAVRFDPTSAQDEGQAEQESDYVSYIFNKKNKGFLTYYTWFKDALLQKNGYVKTYWDESEETTSESYTDLLDAEFSELLSDPEVEATAHTERQEFAVTLEGEITVTLHDVDIKRTQKRGNAVVEPVPPEEFLINADHKSIFVNDARFVAHRTVKTVAELVAIGFDFDKVKDLPSVDHDYESEDRNTTTDEDDDYESADPSQKKIEVYECYPLVDTEENGKATRRKILYVKGQEPLEHEPADCVPFSALTPFIMSHRHIGRSIYDRVKEIQVQGTNIWRQLLDNLYLQNNQRTYVNSAAKVNMNDLLISRPGGIVRGTGAYGEAMSPIVTPPVGAAAFQMLEYLDKKRTERTGVSTETMGQNINLSNDTAHGIERMMTAKEELVGLITRVFGETGVKDMFLQLRALLAKHQDKETVVKLRGKWVPVNPAEWRERTSMTLKVGLGTGDRMRLKGAIGEMLGFQEKLVMAGSRMVQPKNIYNALQDFAKASGMNDADEYLTDPDTLPPKEPQRDPSLVLQEQMAQAQAKLQQMSLQLQKQKQQMDAMLKSKELELKRQDQARKEQEMILDSQSKYTELELEHMKNIPGSVI